MWDVVVWCDMGWCCIEWGGMVWCGVVWDITGYLMHLHVATIFSYISSHRYFEY